MSALLASDEFRTELCDWSLRGVLLAATSAFWAVLLGFDSAPEVVGMLLGVSGWIVAFAAAGAALRRGGCHVLRDKAAGTELAAALGWAAWIKVGLTGAAWVLYGFAAFCDFQDLLQIAFLGMTDTLLGIAALSATGLVAGEGAPFVPSLDSFGWTLVTTAIEGALMAFVIVGIALLLVAFWRVRAAFRPALTLSPVN